MIKINLLPKEARKRVGITEQIVIIVLVLILNFTGIGLYWRYLNGVIEQKRDDIAKTQQRLDELQKVIDEIESFEKQEEALKQKLKVIAELGKEQKLPVHFLDELYLTLVEDMWLNSFNQSGVSLSLQGSALSHPVVADYLKSLEKSEYFSNVELGSVRQNRVADRDIRAFSVTSTLKVPSTFPEMEMEPDQPPEAGGEGEF